MCSFDVRRRRRTRFKRSKLRRPGSGRGSKRSSAAGTAGRWCPTCARPTAGKSSSAAESRCALRAKYTVGGGCAPALRPTYLIRRHPIPRETATTAYFIFMVSCVCQNNHLFGDGPVRIKYLKKVQNHSAADQGGAAKRKGGGKVGAPGKVAGETTNFDSRSEAVAGWPRLQHCVKVL